MMKYWRCGLLSVAVLLGSCAGGSDPAATAPDPNPGAALIEVGLVAGIFPYVPATRIDEIYGELVQELGEDLGVVVQLRSASSFEKFSDALSREEFDIALVQPFDYPGLSDRGYQPIARVDRPLEAILVTTAERDLEGAGIAAVAGLRIGTPSSTSAMSWLLHAELAEAAIDMSTLDIQAFSTHADCLAQLRLGGVDVCVVGAQPLEQYEARTAEVFHVVARTQTVEAITFVARPGLDPAITSRIQAFLVGLDDDPGSRYLLDQLGFPGFAAIEDDDYQRVRELIAIRAGQ